MEEEVAAWERAKEEMDEELAWFEEQEMAKREDQAVKGA